MLNTDVSMNMVPGQEPGQQSFHLFSFSTWKKGRKVASSAPISAAVSLEKQTRTISSTLMLNIFFHCQKQNFDEEAKNDK